MSDTSATATVPFISIKDASIRYQKAEITIRRFVRSILEKEKNADRQLVYPLPSDAVKLKKSKKPFSYTISEELLKRHFGEVGSANAAPSSAHGSYVHLLERTNLNLGEQLKVKDEQIRVLAHAIDDLSERQRETNVLMKGLQERFLLSAPKDEIVEAVVEAGSVLSGNKGLKGKKGNKGLKRKKGSWWKLW
ncbi:MAG: hypothetical protein Greene101449_454 [Candidatus Peregrinibacteria bacterium Greene1014_49]|nr:MAG: hypothetical protein Greene101449_454 [Candidatus Peregrinibacteria bacterium Greene1014_49]